MPEYAAKARIEYVDIYIRTSTAQGGGAGKGGGGGDMHATPANMARCLAIMAVMIMPVSNTTHVISVAPMMDRTDLHLRSIG